MKYLKNSKKHLFLIGLVFVCGWGRGNAQTADSVIYQIENIEGVIDTTAFAGLYISSGSQIDSARVYQSTSTGYGIEYKEHYYANALSKETYGFYNRNFDTGPELWDSVSIYRIHYNTNQEIILEDYHQYNYDESLWQGETKSEYSYLDDGTLTSEKKYLWDTLSQDWFLMSGWQNNIDVSVNTVRDSSVARYHVANRQLQHTDSVNYQFNLAGELIEHSSFDWEDDSNSPNYQTWVKNEKLVYSNSADMVVEEKYVGDNQQWVNSKKNVSTYSAGVLISYQEFKGTSTNSWFEITRNSYDHSVANTLTSRLFSYDPSIDGLRGVRKQVEVFDANDRLVSWELYGLQEDLYGPDNDGSWRKNKKKTYVYNEETVNVDSTRYLYEVLEFNVNYESREFQESKKSTYVMIGEQNITDKKNELIKLEVKEDVGGDRIWKMIFDANN